jgi:hypothetical protein
VSRDAFEHLLDDLGPDLDSAPPNVRSAVDELVASSAARRLEGLGEVRDLATSPEALPYLFALATDRRYPEASALLVRLSAALAAVDSPPRARPSAEARAMVDAYAQHGAALMRVARTSRDPESARAAARILGHLPNHDDELTPLLLALLSGAADALERAPLLYFLARIQLGRGEALHPRIGRARSAGAEDPERIAVLLAHEDAGAADAATLDELATLRAAGTTRLLDPRIWGRAFQR